MSYRNVEKSLRDYKADYQKRKKEGRHNRGFDQNEIEQILILSDSEGKGSESATLYYAIVDALRHGYMVGYKQALRDIKRQQAKG